jgi:hypothetical protein
LSVGENWGKITSPIHTPQHTTTQHNNQTLVAEYAKRYIFVYTQANKYCSLSVAVLKFLSVKENWVKIKSAEKMTKVLGLKY